MTVLKEILALLARRVTRALLALEILVLLDL